MDIHNQIFLISMLLEIVFLIQMESRSGLHGPFNDTHVFTVHDRARWALTEIKSPGFYDCEASNGISVITKGVKITRPNTLRKYINVIDDTYHMTHM